MSEPILKIRNIESFYGPIMAIRGVLASDLVYLRGAQEEMWQKLLQLQFAPNPQDVLRWMLGQGVETTLRAYGGAAEVGLSAATTICSPRSAGPLSPRMARSCSSAPVSTRPARCPPRATASGGERPVSMT